MKDPTQEKCSNLKRKRNVDESGKNDSAGNKCAPWCDDADTIPAQATGIILPTETPTAGPIKPFEDFEVRSDLYLKTFRSSTKVGQHLKHLEATRKKEEESARKLEILQSIMGRVRNQLNRTDRKYEKEISIESIRYEKEVKRVRVEHEGRSQALFSERLKETSRLINDFNKLRKEASDVESLIDQQTESMKQGVRDLQKDLYNHIGRVEEAKKSLDTIDPSESNKG